MTAADTIARLDAALLREGETVTITRGATSVTTRASVRGVKAEEIVGTISQSDLVIVISPTGMDALGKPKATDKITVKGKERQIKFPNPIYVNDTWVRADILAGG